MALNRIECPECGAGLKSPSGFTAGQSVECPKCETFFTVEAAVEDDDDRPVKKKVKAMASRADDDGDDDAPKKKKKKSRDDEDDEKSYKNSPMRYAVLGILVAVMVVLGVMLVMKRQNDREAEEHNAKVNAGEIPTGPPMGPNPNVGPPPKVGGPLVVPLVPPPPGKGNGGIVPKNPTFPPGGPTGGPGLFADTPFTGSPEAKQLLATLRQKLVGTWEGTLDGAVHKVTYQTNGQFTHEVNGKATSGTWQATSLVGGKVMKITRGAAALKVVFEGDELLHDTETAGVSLVLKKK